MKSRTFKQYSKQLLAASILSAGLLSQTHAAPLPDGTLLSIEPGTGSGVDQPCVTGSCFGLEVGPDFWIWTDIKPGLDAGLVTAKNQISGGQETAPSPTNNTSGELTDSFLFFSNYGTFFTAPNA